MLAQALSRRTAWQHFSDWFYTASQYVSCPCAPSSRLPLVVLSILITGSAAVAAAAAAAAAEATLTFRTWASLLSGRMRKNHCNAHHLSAIYNSLMLLPFVTWENIHRGQWKETVGCFSLSLLSTTALFHLSFPQGWFTAPDPLQLPCWK